PCRDRQDGTAARGVNSLDDPLQGALHPGAIIASPSRAHGQPDRCLSLGEGGTHNLSTMHHPGGSEERFLLCRPRFYGVEYVINPWMEGNIGRTDGELARRQWETLAEALAARAALSFIEPVPGLPDMPFTANAGLV